MEVRLCSCIKRDGVMMESYITLAELNTLVPTLFPDFELQEFGWSTMTDPSKQMFMDRAMLKIEKLRYKGEKEVDNQPLKFPMVIKPRYSYLFDDTQTAYWRQDGFHTGIPEALKSAVAKLAVYECRDTFSPRRKMQRDGVTKFSANKVSEEYGKVKSSVDEVAEDYLSKYIFKGGRVGI
jgi:hypothetical protein